MCHTVVLPNDREGHLCGQLVNPNYFFCQTIFYISYLFAGQWQRRRKETTHFTGSASPAAAGFSNPAVTWSEIQLLLISEEKKWFAISPRCFWVTAAMPNPHSVLAGQNANFLRLTHAPCVLVCKMSAFLLLHYLLPTYLDFLRNSIIYRRSRQSFMLILLLLCTFNCVWISL